MSEFERGVRFVMENAETYTKATAAAPPLQFGDYVFSMEPRPAAQLLKGSAEHREKRIQAVLLSASK